MEWLALKLFAKHGTQKPTRDSLRELAETVVFVVVLVLILKLFVVEAFVIPTGSMAETLFGYHKTVQCEQCGYTFPVNSSEEVEGRKGVKVPIVGYHCPNCDYPGKFKILEHSSSNGKYYQTELKSDSGDRVLVHKAMGVDDRGSVVVFKFPSDPQVDHVAQNYIKRLVGFGGETLAIYHGKLFVHKSLTYPNEPVPENPKDQWERRYTYPLSPVAVDAFEDARKKGFPDGAGGFELLRKPDPQVLAMMRVVYHNDFQAADLLKLGIAPRWKTTGAGWGPTEAGQKVFSHTGPDRGFLKYQHLAVKSKPVRDEFTHLVSRVRDLPKPAVTPEASKITNFLGYNTGVRGDFNSPGEGPENPDNNDFWVGDLLLECTASFDSADATVILDLARGPNRYQAQFKNGNVQLIRTGPGGKILAERPTLIAKAGKFKIRFANVDCKLRVWIDDEVVDFDKESEYAFETPTTFDPADSRKEGWTLANDAKEPAALEIQGDATIRNLILSRDTYYTHSDNKDIELDTFFVQPGHYLCFGDNSSQSHDGRGWGQVPERLMLGRAVFIFWPYKRIGFIR